MSDKKVLIIAYYWPPSGGSGVQRWLKFVKYLPKTGWKPYVFTPANPSVIIKDASLLKDVPAEAVVVKFPIWEPYEVVGKISGLFSGKKKGGVQADFSSRSFFSKLSVWVRGNLFIPDPRKFWIKPAVRFLKDYLAKNNIKTIITTGPPHSMHLIGYRLKKDNPSLRWIADMRDPWSEWGFLDSIKAGNRAKASHRKLERMVLTTADEVLTITPFYVRQFERLSGRNVTLITNGFDEDDFKNFTLRRPEKFVIRHAGIVNEKCDPRPFMQAVKQVCLENEEIKSAIEIQFIGQVNSEFKIFVKEDELLSGITKFTHTVSHDELIALYSSSAVLLLILTGYKDAEGYMPGKLFEYLATGLPVMATGPEDGDAANLLNETKSGQMIASDNLNLMKHVLTDYYNQWKNNTPRDFTNTQRYSRKENTRLLSDLLAR